MYNIITYCSKNYYPRLLKTINSWIKQKSVKTIYIYTDFSIVKNDILKSDKIIYKKLFKQSEEFGENCSRKVKCIFDYFNNSITRDRQNDNILFLDIDCFIVKDLSSLFHKDFYIGITVYPEIKEKYKTNNVSSGFVAIKNNVKALDFILQWQKHQDVYGVETPCRDQKSLSETITKIKNNPEYKVILLNSNEYNCHPYSSGIGYVKEWYTRIKQNDPSIIHFSSGTIKNQEIIDEAISLVN